MRVLLDTCAFLWLDANSPEVPRQVRTLMSDSAPTLLLSVASVWEIAVKNAIGKLPLRLEPEEMIRRYRETGKVEIVPLVADVALASARLPLHHRDPFDRLIIAQSLVDGVPLVSSDSLFDKYGVTRIWK